METFVKWCFGALCTLPIFLGAHIYCVTRKYTCPGCGRVFRAKWYAFGTWLHTGDRRVAKCPHCGRKGFCRYE